MESIETSDKTTNAKGAWPHLTDSKIDDKKREMLEEWKDIPDANK